jgi:hypothetical protein
LTDPALAILGPEAGRIVELYPSQWQSCRELPLAKAKVRISGIGALRDNKT